MVILGIGSLTPDGHDSAAALVIDGALVAAAEEERFTRVKHDNAVPLHAIAYCLSAAGAGTRDVDVLAVAERPYWSGRDSGLAWADRQSFRELVRRGLVRKRSYLHKVFLDMTSGRHWPRGLGMNPYVEASLNEIRDVLGLSPPVRFFGHHESHAAATFYLSGRPDSSVLTVDGRGGISDSCVIWEGRAGRLSPRFAQNYADSLGFFYADCTKHLGLGEFGEGKTMGLASYGDSGRFSAQVSQIFQGRRLPMRYCRPPSEDVVGFPARTSEEILEGPYMDFAAAAQKMVEDAMSCLAKYSKELSGSDSLCLGGGVALNCASNGKLLASGDFEDVFVFPAAGDAGLAAGSAVLASVAAGRPVSATLEHSYLGPECTAPQIAAAVESAAGSIRACRVQSMSRVAELLTQGAVIGWVQGRMEFGPRALGARSILADPRSTAIRDRVNRLKGRELWRPLAPMVIEERATEYFENVQKSRFMLFAVNVRESRRSEICGVVHVDGTARPQTVPKRGNPRLRELLEAFHGMTGTPILLNTSFNAAGEPVVCTPTDAIRSFLGMRLDALVIEDWLIQPGDAGRWPNQ